MILAAHSFCFVDSPVGWLRLTARGPQLVGLYFVDDSLDRQRLRAVQSGGVEDEARFEHVRTQLAEYFSGQRRSFDVDRLGLQMEGTPFQQRVWQALTEIPYGQTTTYGAIAQRIGAPLACRAVGAANGRNPISIIVPCHRVIGTQQKLVGYGGGLDRKVKLLSLEGAVR